MISMCSIENGQEWARALEMFSKLSFGVHYLFAYHELYSAKSTPEAVLYHDGGESFFLPYLKSTIPEELIGSGYFDMESAYGYGGPLATCSDDAFHAAAWEAVRESLAERGVIAGFLRFDPVVNNAAWFTPQFVGKVFNREVVLLNMSKDEDRIWSDYSQSVRNKIRKSLKSGVTVSIDSGQDAMMDFAKKYRQLMADLDAGSFYHFENHYFVSIYDTLGKGASLIWAEHQGERVGAALLLEHNGVVTYHLSVVQKECKKLGVACLLRHEAVKLAQANGHKVINYGGGLSGESSDPLFKFKAGFSSERGRFYVGKVVFDEERFCAVQKAYVKRAGGRADNVRHLGYR